MYKALLDIASAGHPKADQFDTYEIKVAKTALKEMEKLYGK